MNISDKSFVDSLKFIHETIGLEFKKTHKKNIPLKQSTPVDIFKNIKRTSNKININDIPKIDEEIMDEYVPNLTIDWLREGILSFTARKFGIGYDYTSKRIILPHRSFLTGEIVGIIGRTTLDYELLDIPKYFPIRKFLKSLNLYGLWENYEDIQKAGYVVVGESEKHVLKRHSRLDPTSVAVCGNILSTEQFRILC